MRGFRLCHIPKPPNAKFPKRATKTIRKAGYAQEKNLFAASRRLVRSLGFRARIHREIDTTPRGRDEERGPAILILEKV
jgi:hypothetical protein